MSDPIHDPAHDPMGDPLGDRLRLLGGARMPAPTLSAPEIRRRADRRRRRRHALGASAACAVAALCVALPSVLQPARPHQDSAAPAVPSLSASPHPRPPVALTVSSAKSAPIAAGTVAQILASCLGADASRYHAVLALRAPVASADADGVVVAVNSAQQYVQCATKGDKGTSADVPATFVNNRLWGTGHLIEYFDSIGEPAGGGQYLLVGAGHYAANITRITISYGTDPTQYPASMAGGAFGYTTALTTTANAGPPTPYVHAYDATGKEVYNQQNDPAF